MASFLCKAQFMPKLLRYTFATSPSLKPYSFLLLSLQYSSVASGRQSFTVSHLTNACGFSPDFALFVSEHISFSTAGKPDSVLAFFRNQGFSNSQITDIIRRYPTLLLANPEKTLLPKFQFFQSKGVSNMEINKIIFGEPRILRRSVENHLDPSFAFLKSFLQSDERTIMSIKRFPGLIAANFQKRVLLTIAIFQNAGMPISSIVYFLRFQPRTFAMDSNRFIKILEEVQNFGFHPSKSNFAHAAHCMNAMSKSSWERKIKIYKHWGWSDEDVRAAFRCHPWCMTLSDDKIMAFMGFFVDELGWESSLTAKRPILISMSLNKRLIPRASVMQMLFRKGLVKNLTSVTPYLRSENLFLDKYVHLHPEEAPHLLKIYNEKMNLGTQQVLIASVNKRISAKRFLKRNNSRGDNFGDPVH